MKSIEVGYNKVKKINIGKNLPLVFISSPSIITIKRKAMSFIYILIVLKEK